MMHDLCDVINRNRSNKVAINTKHLQLHGNPFRCDCRLLEFAHWLQHSGVPRSMEPICVVPNRLTNRTVVTVKLDELACLPQVEPTTNLLYQGDSLKERVLQQQQSDGKNSKDGAAIAGSNVSLRCSVFGLPSAVVSWWSVHQQLSEQKPRLVANGTRLIQSWEDQYYAINEYRTNAHQVSLIFWPQLIFEETYKSVKKLLFVKKY